MRYAITTAILLTIGGLYMRQRIEEARTPIAAEARGPLDDAKLDLGAVAPDFELRALDGREVRLSSLRGKTVVVNFWASWCVPCREEMAEFQKTMLSHESVGDLVVLAVDYLPLDAEPDVQRFLDTRARDFGAPIAFPVVLDTRDGRVAARDGVAPRGAKQAALPVSFFIDRTGVLRDRMFGPVTGTFEARLNAIEDASTPR